MSSIFMWYFGHISSKILCYLSKIQILTGNPVFYLAILGPLFIGYNLVAGPHITIMEVGKRS